MRPSARRSSTAYDTDLIVLRMSVAERNKCSLGRPGEGEEGRGGGGGGGRSFRAMLTPNRETRACQVTEVLFDGASVQRVQRVSLASPNS